MVDGVLVAFLSGALVGAAIHLSGALWYTRRQRIRFETSVQQRFKTAEEAVIGRVKTEVVPMINGRIGVAAREVNKLVEAAGSDVRDAVEEEELAKAVGRKNAQKLLVAEKVLDRLRNKRRRPAEPAPAAPTQQQLPAADPSVPRLPEGRRIDPRIIAELEAQGFKRDKPSALPGGAVADGAKAAGAEAVPT